MTGGRAGLVGATALLGTAVAVALLPSPLGAREPEVRFEAPVPPPRARAVLSRHAETVRTLAMVQRIVREVEQQNEQQQSLEQIREIDRAWAEGEEPEGLARELATNECAGALQSLVAANPGYLTAWVADAQGTLVCMTSRAPAYWLWQDPRWYAAFDEGRGALFVSAESTDQTTGVTVRHLSAPVIWDGRARGVLIVTRIAD